MFYIVTYDQKSNDLDSSLIHSVISNYGDSKLIFSGLWILSSERPIDLDRLCEELKSWLNDNQGLFVSELVDGKANGWLPVTIWNWYKSHSS